MDIHHVVWRNAMEMLYARGYARENVRRVFLPTYTAAIATYDNKVDDSTRVHGDLPHKTLVVMDCNEKVGIDTVRKVIHELRTDIQAAILVIRNKITPFAQHAIDTLRHCSEGYIEVFTFKHLHINICKHQYIPIHHILSADEKAEVSKRFSAKDAVFPKLIPTDPLVRYYGLTQGDMIKFVRKTGYETRVIYRVVGC